MSIGQKFLKRVLSEAKADKDVDGFRDNFDITTISATSPVMAGLALPMARQVVQLFHLLGVSAATLEMRPKAVKTAAMELADRLRTSRPLRAAAQRLFSELAMAKGFSRQEMMEASAVDAMLDKAKGQKDVALMGSRGMKQIEAVLAAMGLPSSVLSRAMRQDRDALMETARLITSGGGRTKFKALATELGIDIDEVGARAEVKEGIQVDEATTVGTVPTMMTKGTAAPAPSAYEVAAQQLLQALGVDVARLPAGVKTRMQAVQRGDRGVGREGGMIVRRMEALTALLQKQGRELQ